MAGGLSLAYIGTDSSTTQRDEKEHRSSRFRLGGKKEAAGVCRGLGPYKYIYGISMGIFLSSSESQHSWKCLQLQKAEDGLEAPRNCLPGHGKCW